MPTIANYDFDEHVELATFVENQPVFALVDGTVHFPLAVQKTVESNDGLLSACVALDGKSIVTGGEDGRVMRVTEGQAELVAEQPRKWIDVVQTGPNGAVGFASGRTVWVATDNALRQFDHERAVEGIAFAPKGMRIACGRYNGVSLHWNSKAGGCGASEARRFALGRGTHGGDVFARWEVYCYLDGRKCAARVAAR